MASFTVMLIGKALDGLQLRQAATAQNIANGNTDSYRPIRVTFEERLREAAGKGPDAIGAVRPEIELAPMPTIASELRLDLEIATASQTALRYGALLSVLEGRGALMRSVVQGGR